MFTKCGKCYVSFCKSMPFTVPKATFLTSKAVSLQCILLPFIWILCDDLLHRLL